MVAAWAEAGEREAELAGLAALAELGTRRDEVWVSHPFRKKREKDGATQQARMKFGFPTLPAVSAGKGGATRLYEDVELGTGGRAVNGSRL